MDDHDKASHLLNGDDFPIKYPLHCMNKFQGPNKIINNDSRQWLKRKDNSSGLSKSLIWLRILPYGF